MDISEEFKTLETLDKLKPATWANLKSLLPFIICGSVDNGKSTLIGRLLYESNLILEDQLDSLVNDSKRYGTVEDNLDFALLVDGLSAEREQGITIDVAYRFFATKKRKFIAIDSPGHEQYTRNMVTGASNARVAIVIIDAKLGVLPQTKRHSFIASILGIKKIIVAVNKMDLVNYQQDVFHDIARDFRDFAKQLKFTDIQIIPVSALKGDNVTKKSVNTPYYNGQTLLKHLETIDVQADDINKSFRMPVQLVNRPNLDFRGFCGRITSGVINVGDKVKVLPSGRESTVKGIINYHANLPKAIPGQSVTITLDDEIDIARGDILATAEQPCEVSDQFEVTVIWMTDKAMIPNRQYILKLATNTVSCTLSEPKYKININTMEHIATKDLQLNDIGHCYLRTTASIPFELYENNRELGGFILIDSLTNDTVASGLINYALRRTSNIYPHRFLVDKHRRAQIKMQTPLVLWFTGLSGSGKSTIANLVEYELNSLGKHTMLLDGDNLRLGLNKDLGFTEADRAENIRRTAEVAKLMLDSGTIVLVALISPFKSDRRAAREIIGEGQFKEIFVDAKLEDIIANRDVKGLYKKAKTGLIPNFTGVNHKYEDPEHADIHLDSSSFDAEACAAQILSYLKENKLLN